MRSLAVAEATPEAHNMGEELVLIVVGATLLVLLQVFARPWRLRLLRSEVVADSAIVGLATAYVFVVLLPELETGHEIIGDYIFLIVLAGFVTLYGLEHLAHRTGVRMGRATERARVFWIRAAVQWAVGFLFVLTWPNALHEQPTFFLLTVVGPALGIALHGYQLSERDPDRHGRFGRWVLASGPIAGAVVDVAWHESNEATLDVMIAFLAGLILFSTVADETYEHDRTRFVPFLGGVGIYVAIFVAQPLHPG